MNPLRILIVDDEPPIRRFLRTALAAQGYRVEEAADGEAALDFLKRNPVDLVVLDLGLPGMDGLEVVRQLRGTGLGHRPSSSCPAATTKPARWRRWTWAPMIMSPSPSAWRNCRPASAPPCAIGCNRKAKSRIFRSGDLTVDLVRRVVTVRGEEVKLTPREYDLLRLLVSHAGKVLTHKFILREVWGGETDVQYLRIYIRTLRQKLEADPEQPALILTEQGVGYRLRSAE